mgnify:CR=1 FL=1
MTSDNKYKLYKEKYDTIVVGSGAAGFNAANRLFENDIKNIAMITEDVNLGTSRNAGSDKQTYYKLALESSDEDSIDKMAEVYHSGMHIHGDIAKVEASESVRAFMNLVELGVEFPFNEYGEYIGYKTDHDPNKRATSAGPYTSKQMTEKLEKKASDYGIEILNHYKVVKIFTSNEEFDGVLCLNKGNFYLIEAKNIIFATGGPANLYSNTVYPKGQKGSTGLALDAGVKGMNLTHFQYGMSSIKPKWNVSGTYMQVMPRFYSLDEEGNEYDFLADYYKDFKDLLNNVFLKGYQWPFDVKKIEGSSMIDYLVYKEEVYKNRRVFLDFRSNPSFKDIPFDDLNREVKEYIISNDARLEKPIDRLLKMNKKAYDFYIDHGVDLKDEPLEISVCAQHNNGGLYIDKNYQTNIKGFYAAGEVAGSHGIYRPGGSALNAGQVGSKRASENINLSDKDFSKANLEEEARETIEKFLSLVGEESNIIDLIGTYQEEMTSFAAAFRNIKEIERLIEKRKETYKNFYKLVKVKNHQLIKAFEFYDIVVGQLVYLAAMKDYYGHIKAKIGGSIYFEDEIDFTSGGDFINQVQVTGFKDGQTSFDWEEVRPILSVNQPFELQRNKYIDRKLGD